MDEGMRGLISLDDGVTSAYSDFLYRPLVCEPFVKSKKTTGDTLK